MAAAAPAPPAGSAPPVGFTKAAYAKFKEVAQNVVKRKEMEGKLSGSELRVLRSVLNEYTQSVFLQLRRHLLLPGVAEPLDPSLEPKLAQAQAAFKAARVQLNEEQNRAAARIERAVRAPLAHLNEDGSEKGETAPVAPGRLPSDADLARIQQRSEQLAALVASLQRSLPATLQSSTEISGFMESRAKQPVSDAVRDTLRRMQTELEKKGAPKRTAARRSATAQAAKEEAEAAKPSGSSGKMARTPSKRLSARLAAKPY